MSSSTNTKGSNPPPAGQSQDDGVRVSDTTPLFPTGTYTQHQQQLMTMLGMNVPVLPSSSTNDAQENQINNIPIDPTDPPIDPRLPSSNIVRIMKAALNKNIPIAKEAKQDMEKYAVEFILFITGEAREIMSVEERKTLDGDDVLKAMRNTGFEHYAEALRPYLERFRARDRRGLSFDLKLEEEDEETVAAGKRRRAPTPESPPSSL